MIGKVLGMKTNDTLYSWQIKLAESHLIIEFQMEMSSI